jgi:hypothetical protein
MLDDDLRLLGQVVGVELRNRAIARLARFFSSSVVLDLLVSSKYALYVV